MTTNAGETIDPVVMIEQELTPERLRCGSGLCPAVYQTSDGDFVIIGKILSAEVLAQVSGKIGADEFAIKISPEFFENIHPDR